MPTPFRHRLWLGLIFWLVWACSVAAGSYGPATNAVGVVAEVATYDGLDRMLTETSVGVAHVNSWDKQGNRLQVVQGRTGRIVQSGYDHLNRLVRMEERLPSESQSRTTLYSYDRNGNVVQKTQANGLVELTEYDAPNRRTRQELKQGTSSLNAYSYAYDRQSNLCGMVESFAQTSAITVAGQTITNTYDKAYRLIEEDVTKDGKRVTTSYSHDAANNRTQKSVLTRVSGQPDVLELHTYTYGDASNGLNSNQLATWTRSNGPQVTYTYDANGNRATRVEGAATDTYTYDYWNRLVELNLQSGDTPGTYRYAYDHRTRRVVRDESAVTGRTRDLIVFSSGLSAQEYTGATGSTPTGQPHVEYMRGSDWGGGVGGILYSLADGQPSWSHNNGRGDITARTDATGTLTYAASYEAYGQRTQEAGSNPTRQQANSKDEDPTGLLNEGFRYRDLETGMFITRDPAGFVDGPNVYTYVQQNPWSKFDALGLFWDPDSGVWGFSQYLSFGKAMFVDPTVETYKAGCQHFEDGFRMYDAGEYTLGTLHMLAGTGKVAEIGATVASAGESAVVSKVTSKVASHIDDAAKASSKAASFMDDAGDAVENVSKVATETVGGSARKTAASLSDEEFVQRIADKAESTGVRLGKGASGTGHAQGTWKHDYAKRVLERYKKTTNQKLDLQTEVSFKDFKGANYGEKGSSRLDVFNQKTGEAFDYKFVKNPGKGLTAAQKNRNLKNVRNLKKQTEINPRVP